MANIKSAKKRILVAQTKTERNKSIRSSVKTAIKKVEAAVAANDKEAASAALVSATSVISKAESKGVYHKNNASRKISEQHCVTSANKYELIKNNWCRHTNCSFFAILYYISFRIIDQISQHFCRFS